MMKSDVEPARLQANFKTRVTDFGRGESSIMWVRSNPVIRIDLCSLFERNAGKVLPGSALLATIGTVVLHETTGAIPGVIMVLGQLPTKEVVRYNAGVVVEDHTKLLKKSSALTGDFFSSSHSAAKLNQSADDKRDPAKDQHSVFS